jgi:4-hydroxy-4-methyl-2-oxoglutarate aldolase
MTDLEDIRQNLFVALISDSLDAAGLMHQALPAHIRPLDIGLKMVGRARTGLFMDVYEVRPDENPYELEIVLIDSLRPGDVAVMACAASGRIAPWGELLSTASRERGAVGALMDGAVRDTRAIMAMQFPVFHGGIAPLDSKGRGKLMAIDVAVECAGVRVCPGDLVVGDADGVVVVPRAAEAQVIEAAFTKLRSERSTLSDLKRGLLLKDVYEKYGVL